MFTGGCVMGPGWGIFDSVSGFGDTLARSRWGRILSHQVEFSAIQQLPLDLFTGFKANSGGQRDWKVDVELWILVFWPNRLHFQRIFCLIFHI